MPVKNSKVGNPGSRRQSERVCVTAHSEDARCGAASHCLERDTAGDTDRDTRVSNFQGILKLNTLVSKIKVCKL